jgi:hypothetical protein
VFRKCPPELLLREKLVFNKQLSQFLFIDHTSHSF